jgi:hypothetical protein
MVTCTALLLALALAQADPGREVKPRQQWADSLDDVALMKEAPEHGLVTDAKAFARL